MLITPLWKTLSWYLIVLELLEDYPVTLPTLPDLVVIPARQEFLMKQRVPQLIAWPISGNPIRHGFSSEASSLMLASWRDKSNSNYSSSIAKWARWCHQQGRNPLSGPITDVINFLADLSAQGYQYQSLNSYCSAISSVHEAVDGVSVGAHPAVARLLKGDFHLRPPMAKYSSFWDVGTVTSYLKRLGSNEGLSLRHLTLKTTMFLALTRP